MIIFLKYNNKDNINLLHHLYHYYYYYYCYRCYHLSYIQNDSNRGKCAHVLCELVLYVFKS